MDIELFFEKLFINSEKADDICKELEISRKEYSEYSKILNEERKDEVETIKRIRSLYHNKKGESFKFPNLKEFYEWYKRQYEFQNGECYYCKTKENVIAKALELKYPNRQRPNRGNHLEIERKDSDNNYNEENCVLACYFCNNDKSDIFNEHDYFDYLKDRKTFFNNQYEILNK